MKPRTAFIAGMATQHAILTAIGLQARKLREAQEARQAKAESQQAIMDFLAAANGQNLDFSEPSDGEPVSEPPKWDPSEGIRWDDSRSGFC